MTTATDQLHDILANGFRTLPGPIALAALIRSASKGEQVSLFLRLEEFIGTSNACAMWFAAEGVNAKAMVR